MGRVEKSIRSITDLGRMIGVSREVSFDLLEVILSNCIDDLLARLLHVGITHRLREQLLLLLLHLVGR